MRNQTFISILKWSIYVLLAASLFSPLLVSSRYLFPFITTKTLFFRGAVELALLLYVILCFLDSRYRPKFKNPIVYALLAYLGIATIAGLVGINWYKSFWSTVERGEGLILLYHLFVWFMIFRGVVASQKAWNLFLHVNSLATFGVVLYAWAQQLNFSFVLYSGASRVSGTLGNPAFFAAYILFGIFVSLRFILDATQKWFVRGMYGVVFVLELIILYQTETRGSLLAFVGGVVLLAILYVLKSRSKNVRISAVSLGTLMILLLGAVFVFRNSSFVRSHNTLSRIGSIVSAGDITKQSRIYAWDSSWKGFRDHPIFGYGYEHYNVAFNKYFHPEIFIDSGSQIWFDRAHNTVFDVLITSGGIGLIAYLAIFVLMLQGLWKRYRKNSDGVVLYGIIGVLLIAHFFQNLFVFDTLPTFLWFFFLLAYVSFLLRTKEEEAQLYYTKFGIEHVVSVVVIGLLVVIVFRNAVVLPEKAAYLAVKGLAYQQQNFLKEGFSFMQEAIAMNTNYTYEIRHKYAESAIYALKNKGLSDADKKYYLSTSIDGIKKNQKMIPEDVQNHMYLISIYNAYDAYEPAILAQVYEEARKALELSPTRPQIYFGLGQAAISQKRFQQGIEYFKKALNLNPLPFESNWNLAAAYEIAGKHSEAEKIYQGLTAQGFPLDATETLQKMIPVYMEAKNYQKLKEVYEILTLRQPQTTDHWTRLAAVYMELQEYENARKAVTQAVELDPSLADEAEVFLKQIEGK